MPDSDMSFARLGLPKPLVSGLARRGIETPFPIQTACIPDVLAGRDVLGRGQTGSGKTLAFGLPLMARVAGGPAAPKRPRALILVPTRELAMQVNDALEPLGRGLSVRMKTVVGGTSFTRQVDALRRGVEVLVATPGRLTDLIQQGKCDLSDVEVTVLDEADQMADMGFLPAVTALLEQVRPEGQRLLFSATLDRDVDTLVKRFLSEPVTHDVTPPEVSVATMDHHLLLVDPHHKNEVTAEIANRDGRTILFVRTKHGVDRLVKQLNRVGVRAGALHGGKTQSQRTRTLAEFREGAIAALVATDVAARGIHVDDVSLVVHVDPPADHKDYLHRAGRTARAGESGTVVTLVLPDQVRKTRRMTRDAGLAPPTLKAVAGDQALASLTGARAPSGEPVEIAASKPRGASAGGRRGGFAHNPRKARAGRSERGAPRSEPTTRVERDGPRPEPTGRAEHRRGRRFADAPRANGRPRRASQAQPGRRRGPRRDAA